VTERIGDLNLVFLPHLKRAEEGVAARIRNLCEAEANFPVIDFEKAVAWCQTKTGKELAPSQQAALRQAISNRMLIITGGPGVGKTTLVNAILLISGPRRFAPLRAHQARRQRLEATGLEARAIHRC
jgi:exodeoxyribonuclease V alpha subunit